MTQVITFSKFLLSLLVRILIAALVGALLLTAVYLLPTAPMEANLADSAATFESEGTYPVLFSWCTSQLDNYTDAIILQNAAHNSGAGPLTQAMAVQRHAIGGLNPAESLVQHYAHGVEFDAEEPYYQYWHGYLLYAKPLLMLLNYDGIRVVNTVVQLTLLALLVFLLWKKDMKRYILPFLIAIAFLMPAAMAKSLQFTSCYCIFMAGSIALLLMKDRLEAKEAYIFLTLGIATAYFDFLTYPMATLGVPAVIYCCMRRRTTVGETLFKGIKLCFSWGVGYIGMWASKWILGSIVIGGNVLTAATEALTERSSLTGAQGDNPVLNLYVSLMVNVKSFIMTPVTLVMAVVVTVLLVLLILAIRKHKPAFIDLVRGVFPFLVLACLPPVWYLATTNHSIIHHWFTNKALIATVLAALCALVKMREEISE